MFILSFIILVGILSLVARFHSRKLLRKFNIFPVAVSPAQQELNQNAPQLNVITIGDFNMPYYNRPIDGMKNTNIVANTNINAFNVYETLPPPSYSAVQNQSYLTNIQ